jgi:hypothetical protein
MKKLFIMAALMASTAVFAADTYLERSVLGVGPNIDDGVALENAKIVNNTKIENNILHAPQYMPNYPTAAAIWPRVVEIPCTKLPNGDLTCASYNWSPSMGRGEYLFVTPKVVVPVEPVVHVYKEQVPGPTVYVEVPVKKKKE